MKKSKSILLIICLLLIVVCSCKPRVKSMEASHAKYIRDTISLNSFLDKNYNPGHFKYYADAKSKKEYFVYYNEKDTTLNFEQIGDITISSTFKLPEPFKKFSDYYVVNMDSVLVFEYPGTLYSYTPQGTQTFQLNDSIPVYGRKFELNTMVLFPMTIINGDLYIYNFPAEPLDSQEKFIKYYSTPRDTRLKIEGNELKVKALFGTYPEYYKKNSNYVFSPVRTVGKDNELIYSFDDSKEIYITNVSTGKTISKVLDSGTFRDNTSFDQSKNMDYNYISKYYTENDRFVNLQYDSFRNRYYRILSKGIKSNAQDEMLNRPEDKPFVILEYDDNFNLLKEITFPADKYVFTTTYISEKGVQLLTYTENENKTRYAHTFVFE